MDMRRLVFKSVGCVFLFVAWNDLAALDYPWERGAVLAGTTGQSTSARSPSPAKRRDINDLWNAPKTGGLPGVPATGDDAAADLIRLAAAGDLDAQNKLGEAYRLSLPLDIQHNHFGIMFLTPEQFYFYHGD